MCYYINQIKFAACLTIELGIKFLLNCVVVCTIFSAYIKKTHVVICKKKTTTKKFLFI